MTTSRTILARVLSGDSVSTGRRAARVPVVIDGGEIYAGRLMASDLLRR